MATYLPDDFMCPISLELMSDPVILSSGHTFDRKSIQRWIDEGHRTCPITKLPLTEKPSLIPNHALRSLISNHYQNNNNNSSNNNDSNIDFYFINLQTLISSLAASPLVSLEALARASKRDATVRRRLAESGAVSAVLRCVGSAEPRIREKALSLLLNLSLDDDNKIGLVAEGVIGHLITVLHSPWAVHDGRTVDTGVLRGPGFAQDGCMVDTGVLCGLGAARDGRMVDTGVVRGRGGVQDGSRATAATILTSLAVVEVNKATIGAYPFALCALISLLSSGNGRERKEAATALYTLCSYPENRRRSVEFGCVPILVNVASMGLERAVEVLGLLAKCKEGRSEMAKVGNFVSVLVYFLKNGSPRGVQYALSTMGSLCMYSEGLRGEVLGEGVFEYCVGLLEDESEKVRRNAANLIQILRGKR